MIVFKKPIFTGFLPNSRIQDALIAWSFLFLPWKWFSWKYGKNVLQMEQILKNIFPNHSVKTFDSGRTALLIALKSLGIKKGDEVIVQAYTCRVVINAIIWSGAKPIYVDINNDLNINTTQIENAITQDTKALIIQHTFGLLAKTHKIIEICKKHNIKTIEDCAHSFMVKDGETYTGTKANIGMFSFGGEKVLPASRGGALISSEKDIIEKITLEHSKLAVPKKFNIFQHLVKILIFYKNKPLYFLGIGKLILTLAQKINLLAPIITSKEKIGDNGPGYPSTMPNALAGLFLSQWKHFNSLQKHRKTIANIYFKELQDEKVINFQTTQEKNNSFLRFPIFVNNPEEIISLARKKGIILGNWYNAVVAPAPKNWSEIHYELGSCPNAEKFAKMTVNLPTNIRINAADAHRVATLVKKIAQ